MSPAFIPHYQWSVALGGMALLWSFVWVRPRFGMFPALFLSFLCLNAIWVWVWVENRYYTINPYDQMALRYFSADSLARALLILVPLMLLNRAQRIHGILAAKIFAVLNSIIVLMGFILHRCAAENSCGGLGNPSIMVGLSVCILPLIASWPITILVTVAAIVSKSSIAIGLLAVYFAWGLTKHSKTLAAIAFTAPFYLGSIFLGKELFNSSDRFMIWAYMMKAWATPWNAIAGTGWGTYHVFSINLQKATELRSNSHWNAMHNDWLQMVFECGVIGGALMIGTYFTAIKRCFLKEEYAVLFSLVLYGIYMGANPALHHALPSLFGAWLIVHALKKNQLKEPLCLA